MATSPEVTVVSAITRHTWSHLLAVGKPFFASELRWRALGMLALIVALVLTLNGLNVVNSYVGRGFMTAIADREEDEYVTCALLYLVVFAASTVVAVFYQFTQDRLALLWRQWLTRHLVDRYLADQTYFWLNHHAEVDNPDQRISEDVRSFTTTLLSFVLMILNSTLTTIAFAGILWSITPWLLEAALGYALFGSVLTLLLGRRLVGLDNLQLKKEADLRYALVQVREHADAVSLMHGEAQEQRGIRRWLERVVENSRAIIAVNRNLGFFTGFYNYLVPILPVFITAPLYLRGEIEFGVVTQSAMAFAQLLGALSIFVAQFQNISVFAAVVGRLGSLWQAMQEDQARRRPIRVGEDDARVAYDGLTVRTTRGHQTLIKDLPLEIPHGQRLLIVGDDGAGKSALFRATAGIWGAGHGRVLRPRRSDVMFLPQNAHTVQGNLRDQLLYGMEGHSITDEQIHEVLRLLKFEPVLERVGGLEAEHDWATTLSVGEQQLLGVARLLLARPRFAFLDQAVSALAPHRAKQIYQVLADTPISYISVGDHIREYHDQVLELHEEGVWYVRPAQRVRSA
jgi:putative ATP-binding cassette transporter